MIHIHSIPISLHAHSFIRQISKSVLSLYNIYHRIIHNYERQTFTVMKEKRKREGKTSEEGDLKFES